MKKMRILIVLLITIFLSGCSFANLEMNNLMHPPKATGEMAEIQALIEKTVGADIVFKYPQNGENRTAIMMHDIDADGEEEAVAVYQTNAKETQAYIIIIDKINGEWQVKKNIISQNTELDKVCFGDVNGNGKDDIILGWSSYVSYGKELTVILDENEDYTFLYPKEKYSDLIVSDFDDDGKAEILTLSLSRNEDNTSDSDVDRAAKAKLLKMNINNLDFSIMDTVLMDSTVVKYNNIKFGNIDDQQRGAVIDGTTKKGKVTTEIVYWNRPKNKLIAPLYDSQTFSANEFLRDSVIQSSDLNNDGIIEIPKVELKQDNTIVSNVYVLSWYKFDTRKQELVFVKSVIMNDSDSYIFVLPDKWKNNEPETYRIILDYDYDLRIMTVNERVENAMGNIEKGPAIMSILLLTAKEYEEMEQEEKNTYIFLWRTQQKIYLASVLSDNSEYSLTKEEIMSNFEAI